MKVKLRVGSIVTRVCNGGHKIYGEVVAIAPPEEYSSLRWVRVEWANGKLQWWEKDHLRVVRSGVAEGR